LAANKRTKFQIASDREQERKWYLQGWTQAQMAEKLGIDRSMVSRDLKAIQEEWKRNTTFALDEYKARELAKIDHAERCYWEIYERSIEEFRSKTIMAKAVNQSNENGQKGQSQSVAKPISQVIHTESRNGDSRALDGVLKCIERRCKLLGLDAPQKREHIGKDGGPITVEQRRNAIEEQLKNNPDLMEKLKNAFSD
jgi:hypothetical protein